MFASCMCLSGEQSVRGVQFSPASVLAAAAFFSSACGGAVCSQLVAGRLLNARDGCQPAAESEMDVFWNQVSMVYVLAGLLRVASAATVA